MSDKNSWKEMARDHLNQVTRAYLIHWFLVFAIASTVLLIAEPSAVLRLGGEIGRGLFYGVGGLIWLYAAGTLAFTYPEWRKARRQIDGASSQESLSGDWHLRWADNRLWRR